MVSNLKKEILISSSDIVFAFWLTRVRIGVRKQRITQKLLRREVAHSKVRKCRQTGSNSAPIEGRAVGEMSKQRDSHGLLGEPSERRN